MAEVEKITETLETPKVDEEVVLDIVNPEERSDAPLSEASKCRSRVLQKHCSGYG